MHQNRWSVLGDPRQVPDPIFGKMGKIIFCKFCLNTVILNILHFFSKFAKIHFVQNWSKLVPGGGRQKRPKNNRLRANGPKLGGPPDRSRTRFSEKWEKLFFVNFA